MTIEEYEKYEIEKLYNYINQLFNDKSIPKEEQREILEEAYEELSNENSKEHLKIIFGDKDSGAMMYEAKFLLSMIPKISKRIMVAITLFNESIISKMIQQKYSENYYDSKFTINFIDLIEETKDEKQKELLKQIYFKYKDDIKYLGYGDTTIAYQIKDKVLKIGPLRKENDFPYALPIYEKYQLSENKYVYITDKCDTNNITEDDVKKVYIALRKKGYVWTDPKTDNLGKLNNELKIIDDIDVKKESYYVNDSFSGYKSCLDLQATSIYKAVLEMEYLKQTDKDFTFKNLENYLGRNKIEKLRNIEVEYLIRYRNYVKNKSLNNYLSFINKVKEKINEKNSKKVLQL